MDKETVPFERLAEQEANGAKDFFEMGKKAHIAIIGMGGRLVSQMMDESIYIVPEGTSLEELKKILSEKRGEPVECPGCEAGLPVVEKQILAGPPGTDYFVVIDSMATLLEGQQKSFEMIPEPVEKYTPPGKAKRTDIPKPFKRKGKYKHGWK